MTNEEILRKMNDDMKMRNFSKYSFYTYSHKGAEMMKYFNKPMEEVTTDEMRKFLIMLKEERHLANKTVNYYNSILRFMYEVTMAKVLNKNKYQCLNIREQYVKC